VLSDKIPAETFFIQKKSLQEAVGSRQANSGSGVGSNRSGGFLAKRIIELDTFAVSDTGAAENIEGGTDGEVDAVAAEFGD
jgi:hypothetical protein